MGEKRFAGAGRFVWHELSTVDVDQAAVFYGNLFGWQFEERYRVSTGTYRSFSIHGEQIGGMVPLDKDAGESSFWLPFVTVENLEQSTADALTLGGTILSPASIIAGFGDLAVVEDPGKARIAAFTADAPGEEVYDGPPRPGTFLWNDLLSRDPEGSATFYCGLFGWRLFTMDLGEQGSTYILRRGEVNEGGIIQKPEEAEGDSTWLPYVAVEDVNLSCMKALQEGGSIFVPPSDLHGAGLYSVIGDPGGAFLALLQLAPPEEGS